MYDVDFDHQIIEIEKYDAESPHTRSSLVIALACRLLAI